MLTAPTVMAEHGCYHGSNPSDRPIISRQTREGECKPNSNQMVDQLQCYQYRLYGLVVAVNQPVDGLTVLDATQHAVDLNLKLMAHQSPDGFVTPGTVWEVVSGGEHPAGFTMWQARQPAGVYHRWQYAHGADCIELLVSPQGTQAWLFWSRAALQTDAISLLLGTFFGLLLQLRGMTCLHAAVMAIDGKSVAFVGRSGAGKSTAAAAFAAQGVPILTDDIAALQFRDAQVWVQPSYPRLRLWPSSVQALAPMALDLAPVSIHKDKRYLELSPQRDRPWPFQEQPLPLRRVYVLDRRDPTLQLPTCHRLSQAQALMALLQDAYWVYGWNRAQRPIQFQQLSQLVHRVPVFKLARPDNLASLPHLCDLVLTEVRANHSRC